MADQSNNKNKPEIHGDQQSLGPVITSPAYFLSLSIENFRCFKDKQTLNLSQEDGNPARWTLILGDNGVGKTSLLQILAQMQLVKRGISQVSQYNYNQVVPRLFIIHDFGDKHLKSLIEFERTHAQPDKPVIVNCSISCGYSLSTYEEMHQVKYHVNFYQDVTGSVLLLGDESALICYGYGANRRMGSTSLSESMDADTSASLFSDSVELLNAEEWLLQADYAVKRSDAGDRVRAEFRFNRVKKILTDLLPDVEDLRIAESSLLTMSAHVQVKTPYGWVPIQKLSLGYRTLLTWMVDLAARLFERYPTSDNPLAEPAVVLVDEIDLHLHPRWQRTLLQFLSDTFPKTQFIATAHSPLVVQASVDANIVLLRRVGDHVVIDNNLETIKGWRIDQILTSDLFGLDSARPPQLDDAIKERDHILGKSRLTKKDKDRLAELRQAIGDLPTGESPADIEAMDIIRRAANLLK